MPTTTKTNRTYWVTPALGVAGIDLRATAVTAVVMILAVLACFVVEVARDHDGSPYVLIGAVGGVAYLGAVGYFRVRS